MTDHAEVALEHRWGSFDGKHRKVARKGHFAEYTRRSGILGVELS